MSELSFNNNNAESNNLLGALQAVVTNRILHPYGDKEPVTFEFTQDPALLHQYYRLREVMYKAEYNDRQNFENYYLGEDFHDKISHILIARRGNLCLGGCRLTIREGDEAWDLPMEGHGFNLRETFSDLPLNTVRHAEISRFAVMEDCGEANIFSGLCELMYNKVTASDISYLFVISSYTMARSWRFIANSFGVKTTKIIDGVHPIDEALPDIKWYLVASDLTSLCNNDDNAKNSTRATSETLN